MTQPRQSPTMIIVLALTQTIGWGTTYYLPSVLARDIAHDVDLSNTLVFAAITMMLVLSAVISPRVGAYLDQHRPAHAMMAGSLALAVGLVIVAYAKGPVQYLAGWAITGVGSASALTLGAHVAVVQRYGAQARHFLTLLMLTGGISVGVFWPLTNWLLGMMSWRAVVLLYAAIHVVVCAPLHFLFAGRSPAAQEAEASGTEGALAQSANAPGLKMQHRKAGLLWLVVAFASAGFVSWGLPLHYVTLFSEAGLSVSLAVTIGALTGPSQIVARFTQWLVLDRFAAPLNIVLTSAIVIVLVMTLPVVLPFTYVTALVFTVIFGFASGLISMARATLPLFLFGTGGFGSLLGRMMRPLNFAFAASPMLYAYVMQVGGTTAAKWLSLVVVIASALAFWRLASLVAHSRKSDV